MLKTPRYHVFCCHIFTTIANHAKHRYVSQRKCHWQICTCKNCREKLILCSRTVCAELSLCANLSLSLSTAEFWLAWSKTWPVPSLCYVLCVRLCQNGSTASCILGTCVHPLWLSHCRSHKNNISLSDSNSFWKFLSVLMSLAGKHLSAFCAWTQNEKAPGRIWACIGLYEVVSGTCI